MVAEAGDDTNQAGALTLSATYASPSNAPFAVQHNLPAPAADNIAERTAFLAGLRKAVLSTQEQVNKELTARMNDDKAHEAGAASSSPSKKRKPAVDEAKEEENYGEEVVEEDA